MSDNRQILVSTLPEGTLAAEHFELVSGPIPEPADGEVLCRTVALTMGAGQRAGLQGSASYAGAPRTGVVMGGTGAARVVASRHPSFAVGDLVIGPTGWQDYAAIAGEQLTPIDAEDDPALHLGVLGTNGLTAYFGLFDVGQPESGDTVLVSAAVGSVGHFVGQMAALHGCRAIAVTSSEDKGAIAMERFGYGAAVSHRDPNFRDALKAAVSDHGGAIDIYFDNTGGDILGAALRRMRVGGRIVCCGVVSQYDTANPQPGPRGIPGLLVNYRLRMQGFLVFDYVDRFAEARQNIRGWIREGKLRPHTDERQGLAAAPSAFVDVLAGGNIGTRIIRLED